MAAKVLMELMVRLSSRFKSISKANTLDAPPPGHDPIAINPNPVTGSIPIISAIARATCNEVHTWLIQSPVRHKPSRILVPLMPVYMYEYI